MIIETQNVTYKVQVYTKDQDCKLGNSKWFTLKGTENLSEALDYIKTDKTKRLLRASMVQYTEAYTKDVADQLEI